MKLTRRITRISILSSIFSILLIMLIVGIFIFYISHTKFNKDSENLRESYYNGQRELIKDEVHRTYDYIEYHKSKTEERLRKEINNRIFEVHRLMININESNNDKAKEEIEKMIKDALKGLRFNDGKGYYFAFRLDGTIIINSANPEIEGRNLLNTQDSEGRYVIKDMIKIAKTSREGFYEYTWTKPNSKGNEHRKISFIKYFEPLDIYVGTGLYIEDIEDMVKKEVLDRISKIRYGNDGYIFVTTYDGTALVFAQEEYIGKNVGHIKDRNGVNIHDKQLKTISKNGEGFVEYVWSKPNAKGQYPKITFVKGIKDWKWIVATGVYVDEIERTIKIMKFDLEQEIQSNILIIMSIILLIGIVIISIQLYLLKRAKSSIKEEEKLYEILTNLSEDGIFILEANGKIIESNHKGLEMLSYFEEDVTNLNFKELIGESLFEDEITKISEETYLRNNINTLIPVELNIKQIELNRKNKYIAYVRDLTKRKNYEEILRQMAITDELTDVFNRRFMINKLKSEIQKIETMGNTVSLVLLDIDRFKKVNDTYGHVFGDEVLKILAKTFKDNLRQTDYVGRYGGEEFIVILSNIDKITASKAIERIKNIFGNLKWQHEDLKITFSAGILEINTTNNDKDIMGYINAVDKLLYKAKQNGRNRIEIS